MSEEKSLIKISQDAFGKFKTFFDSPMALYERAKQYIQVCENNPLYISEQLNRPGKGTIMEDGTYIPPETIVEMPRKRSPTYQGLAMFCGTSATYFYNFKANLKKNKVNDPEGHWMNVMDMIDDMIFVSQYEAAAAGQINHNIVARYLNLSEKVETKNETKVTREVFRIGDMEFDL